MEGYNFESSGPRSTVLTVPAELKALRAEVKELRAEVRQVKDAISNLTSLVRGALNPGLAARGRDDEETLVSPVSTDFINTSPAASSNMNFGELFKKTLFKKSNGKAMKFLIVRYGNFSRHDNILTENCATLIEACGGVVIKHDMDWNLVPEKIVRALPSTPIEGAHCLLFQPLNGRVTDEREIEKLRKKLNRELFSPNYVWHSMFAKRRLNLENYRLCDIPLPKCLFATEGKPDLQDSCIWEKPRGPKLAAGRSQPTASAEFDLVSSIKSLVPQILKWKTGHCAEFLLTCEEDDEAGPAIRNSITKLIELAGGKVLNPGSNLKRQDAFEIPIFLGGTIPRVSHESGITNAVSKLGCEVFVDDFITTIIFSRFSLKARIGLMNENEVYSDSIPVDDLQNLLTSFAVKPLGVPVESRLVSVFRGEMTWKEVVNEAWRKKWHTTTCAQGKSECFGCMDSERNENDDLRRSSSTKQETSFLSGWMKAVPAVFGLEDKAKYLETLRCKMKPLGKSNNDIAREYCKKYTGQSLLKLVKDLNTLDAEGSTALDYLHKLKKREWERTRKNDYKRRKTIPPTSEGIRSLEKCSSEADTTPSEVNSRKSL